MSREGSNFTTRKRKLMRLDLQIKVVFITLFVTSLVLLINFQLNLAAVWALAGRYINSQDTTSLIEAFKKSTVQTFLLSIGMAVPLAASVGVLYSFKFCGPIFRFKQYFASLKEGRWDERCMLRKGDDLHDVSDTINESMDLLRDRLRRDHALFQEVKQLLEANPSIKENSSSKDRLDKLHAEIDEEDEFFRERFRSGPSAAPADGVSEALTEDPVAQDSARALSAEKGKAPEEPSAIAEQGFSASQPEASPEKVEQEKQEPQLEAQF